MKYRLSQVQSTRDDRVAFAGVGFDIVNERGAPIVTFGYLDQRKATNARALIEKAIVDAALIAPAGAHASELELPVAVFVRRRNKVDHAETFGGAISNSVLAWWRPPDVSSNHHCHLPFVRFLAWLHRRGLGHVLHA
jgi:hypothetical protein